MNTDSIYKNIFDLSPSPSAVFDSQGKCLMANRSFFVQLGYEYSEDAHLPPLRELFHPSESAQSFLNLIQTRDVIRRWETHFKTRDKDTIPILLSGRTMSYQDEKCYEVTFTNISHQEQLRQSIRRGHRRIASLIENLTSGLFLVNRKGFITEANNALGNMLHCNPQDFISQHYNNLFSSLIERASEPDIVQYTLREAVQNVIQRPELELHLNEGRQYLEIKMFPVWDEDGQSLGWGGLLQDVTEMREQITWKLELLSMLAHDLRTPLATLKGHATALLANYQSWTVEMGMEFLKTIDRNVDELIRQVDRNLALTRVDTGRLGLRPESIHPKDLIDQAVERAAGSLGEVTIEFELPDKMPQLRIDPARAEEVIINLLDNAARYTPQNQPIAIRLQVLENMIQISVIDHGPGIPLEKQTRIFEKYVRGDENEGGGTGLGLYISRKIVEAHGGRIWVDSPLLGESQGTALNFTLPLLPDLPIDSSQQISASKQINLISNQTEDASGEKILVIEDESDVQALLHTVLSQQGYQVEIAPDGPTALDIIQTDPPNLVLLDWVMPKMSGPQVCRSIRNWSNVPIIMVTSKTSQEDLVAALDAGADDYVTKPFQTEELLARIRTLIRRKFPAETEEVTSQFIADGLRIDFGAHSAWLSGNRLDLTPTEYKILVYLAQNRGQVITYGQLIDEIGDPAETRSRHRLFVHISRLREKIEQDPKNPHFIRTQWGIGYVFLPKE